MVMKPRITPGIPAEIRVFRLMPVPRGKENMKMEIITTGDPDGLGDLKRYNQICIRAESYIGWGILDPNAFAKIVNTTTFAVPSGAATAAAKMFEVNVSSLQSGVAVNGDKITGTLKYMKADNGITSVCIMR